MKLLTVSEVAELLRVSGRTVRRWAQRGTLPVVRMSERKLLFDEAAVEVAVRARTQAPPREAAE